MADKTNNTVLFKLIELTQIVYWNLLLNAEELASKPHEYSCKYLISGLLLKLKFIKN